MNVVKISISGTNAGDLVKARDTLIKRHLVAALSYNKCDCTYWQGGQIINKPMDIIRGITYYEKIKEIAAVIPSTVLVISACPTSYLNPKTERWLNESLS